MREHRWFHSRGRTRNFAKTFGHLKRQPASYLEIGVFRGASLEWMLDRILTDPASCAVGVDPWDHTLMGGRWNAESVAENKRLAEQAVDRFGPARVRLLAMTSDAFFADLRPEITFDAIYLDGQHDREPLGRDFRNAWRHLKVGGSIILDDFAARRSTIGELVDVDLAPVYASAWRELFRNYQIGFQKVA